LGSKIDELAKAQFLSGGDDLPVMTKAELQAYAEARGIAGVDQHDQTKDEMIEAIRRAAAG
jgi:hypothetical protein